MKNKNPISSILDEYGVVVLDGGMGTELERRGSDLDDPLWSARALLETPELVEQVHYDYFCAGADVAVSASYQATVKGFTRVGLGGEKAAELIHSSVRIAHSARLRYMDDEPGKRERPLPLVAASLGSYGAFLADGSEFSGDYGLSVDQLIDFHRPRLELLLSADPDLVAFETLPSLLEGEAVTRLLEDFSGTTAWLSFSCRNETEVCHGESFAECVALADQIDEIAAVGLNCTPPRFVPGLLDSVRGSTSKPLLAYPNSGEVWHSASHSWLSEPDAMDPGPAAKLWHRKGARLIGGCCRTTPAYIAAVSDALRKTSS
jgi:homocysteine S-methyltransferase